MARLGLRPGQLGVHRLVGAGIRGSGSSTHDQEVGDASHPVVDERHLIDDVKPDVQGGCRPAPPSRQTTHPLAAGNLEDVEALALVFGQAVVLVLEALVGQEPSERAERTDSTVRAPSSTWFRRVR